MIDDFDNSINILINIIADLVWSPLSILLLIGTGLYLSFKFKFIQIKYLKTAFYLLIYGHDDKKDDQKQIKNKHSLKETIKTIEHDLEDVLHKEDNNTTQKLSGFQALSTVLSGTIGTGNIAGVATAVVMGGPGALFWMWVTAFFGMATKFCSCTLAHYYRQKDSDNNIIGGPMITLLYGLNYHKLSKLFAAFMILGCLSTGSMVQANSIVDGVTYLIPALNQEKLLIGVIISITCGIVILGGVKRIANVASIIVPFMAIAYVSIAIFILALHYYDITKTFSLIFNNAFTPNAITGASLWLIIRSGVSRGLLASEAGLGTAPIALATMDTKNSIEAGFIGMIGPLFDTLIICTMTGLIIIASGAYELNNTDQVYTGAQLSQHAFAIGLSCIGEKSSIIAAWIVGLGLVLFAFTTILTWSYYGDRCVSFLFGDKYINLYRVLFLAILVMGSILKLDVVWKLADIANIGMAIPNLIAVILLRKTILNIVNKYKYSQ